MKEIKVLFVCLGNICRSPMAEGIFRALVEREGMSGHIRVDSAGTHAYHMGDPPDPRAQATAGAHGVDISGLRGRQAVAADFDTFDYVLAMDEENLDHLLSLCPPAQRQRVRLFLEYATRHKETEVPDPYYGGPAGFERVFALLEDAAQGLLAEIRAKAELSADRA